MTLYIKYMVSLRCRKIVHTHLDKLGIQYNAVNQGEVKVKTKLPPDKLVLLQKNLVKSGFELMDNKKARLIENIKKEVSYMLNNSDDFNNVKNSEYLSGKLHYDYTYLANLFSETTGTTIEQYIISEKIELVKELLLYNELNLTEISYKLNYCNVAHLSQQFKKVTGLTPTFFKNIKKKKPVSSKM